MNDSLPKRETGFTLIEVLVSLALCVLLATATASAVAFAARAEQLATRHGDASLILKSLYAAQRLRPDDLPVLPPGWRVDTTTEIVKRSDDRWLERFLLSVHSPGHEAADFTLQILDDKP